MVYTQWKKEYLAKVHAINISDLKPLEKVNAKRALADLLPLTQKEFEERK